MPALVRYRSTAAMYDEGGADKGTIRACGSRSAPPAPSSVTGSSSCPSHPSDSAAVNAYTSPGGRNGPPQVAVITVEALPQ